MGSLKMNQKPRVDKEIYRLLHRVQKRLNLIITGIEAFTCTTWLAAAAGLLILFRLWPERRRREAGLVRFSSGCSCRSLASWPGGGGAAETPGFGGDRLPTRSPLQLQEIFSAALFCLGRAVPARLTGRSWPRAGRVARRRSKSPPLAAGPLYRRALPAAAALLFMALIPAALGPAFSGRPARFPAALPAMEEEGGFLVGRKRWGRRFYRKSWRLSFLPMIRSWRNGLQRPYRAGDMEALTGLPGKPGNKWGNLPPGVWLQRNSGVAGRGRRFMAGGEYAGREQWTPPGSGAAARRVWGGRAGGEDPGIPQETGRIGRAGENQTGEEGGYRPEKEGPAGKEEGGEALPAAFAGRAGEEGISREIRRHRRLDRGQEGEREARGEKAEGLFRGLGYEEAVITRSAETPVFAYVLPDRDPRPLLPRPCPGGGRLRRRWPEQACPSSMRNM